MYQADLRSGSDEHHIICTKLIKCRRTNVEERGGTTYSRDVKKFRLLYAWGKDLSEKEATRKGQ